jgi:hypothetical protein
MISAKSLFAKALVHPSERTYEELLQKYALHIAARAMDYNIGKPFASRGTTSGVNHVDPNLQELCFCTSHIRLPHHTTTSGIQTLDHETLCFWLLNLPPSIHEYSGYGNRFLEAQLRNYNEQTFHSTNAKYVNLIVIRAFKCWEEPYA